MFYMHKTFRHTMIIMTSMWIDFVFIFFGYRFIRYAKGPRIIYTLMIFYGIRALCQALFLFQFPKFMCFDDPGIPSLMVPYGPTSDFYFSGHCGFVFIIGLELYHQGYRKFTLLNTVMLAFIASVLIGTRGHYSIGRFLLLHQTS